MTDGTNPPSNPQPEPAPGGGGYGFPPGPPASGGYGYPPGPPASGGYGYPPGPPISGGFGPAPTGSDGYGYPQGGAAGPYQQGPDLPGATQPIPHLGQQPGPPEPAAFTPTAQPDWQALADRTEAQRSRRKLLAICVSAVLVVAAAGGAYFFFMGSGPDEPDKPPVATSDAPEPPASADEDGPTVPGEPTLLRDRANSGPSVQLAMSSGLELAKMDNRNEVRLKGGPESYAQGSEQAVDVTKSFTVTTRAYTVVDSGSRMAISQGDGVSYSFELGFEKVNGKPSWVFRVQTGDKGAAATAQQVVADAPDPLKKWTQLTGTYDAEKKVIALYVNDKAAGEVKVTGIWAGPGPVQLGRARHHGIWSGSFVGSLDRIRIWTKALTPEQVTILDSGKLDKLGKPSHAWLI
ncbi:LamG-like jellyroll fold domain-containing protein [Streptomyces sp. NPDC055254]